MDTQVEQLKRHIAELVGVRREWMVKHESRVVSAADIKEIEVIIRKGVLESRIVHVEICLPECPAPVYM